MKSIKTVVLLFWQGILVCINATTASAFGAFAKTTNSNSCSNMMERYASSNSKDNDKDNDDNNNTIRFVAHPNKTIIFLRHSITYMNEYLGRGLRFGAPGFTDVFDAGELPKYRDTPLSPHGVRLAQRALASRAPSFCHDEECAVDLVVVSPLRRALQTYDLGLKPHLPSHIPVVALPEAAERLYLISDVGRPVHELQAEFPNVDFTLIAQQSTSNDHDCNAASWWWTPAKSCQQNYVEWRPTGRGQRYACPGEPQRDFDVRMTRLHAWLASRPESKIVVVCHHGVVDWMMDCDFDNCQWRQVTMDNLQPRYLVQQEQQQQPQQRR